MYTYKIYRHIFIITHTHTHTHTHTQVRYMEDNPDTFPLSDYDAILARITPDEMAAIDQELRALDRAGICACMYRCRYKYRYRY